MIYGHQRQWQILKKTAERGKISHAWLFSGPDSVGKKTLALEFIKLINKNKIENNPDFLIIENSKKEIQISEIRNIQKFLNLKPYSAPFKTVIIDQAEKMNAEAANCLLKTLEEPKGDSILFLISSKPETLFETIRSRTQNLIFYPLTYSEMKNFFKDKIEKEKLETLLFFSDGCPGKAINLINQPEKLNIFFKTITNLPFLIKSNFFSRFKFLKESKIYLEEFLDIFLKYFRSLLLSKIGIDSEGLLFPPIDYPLEKIKRNIKLGEKINFLISHTNVNPNLAVETLMLYV